MNVDAAKRIVALCRQASGYAGMVRKGVLSQSEADVLIQNINCEIAAIRSQTSLEPQAEGRNGGAGAVAPAGSKKGS